jgi:hypothetical protein
LLESAPPQALATPWATLLLVASMTMRTASLPASPERDRRPPHSGPPSFLNAMTSCNRASSILPAMAKPSVTIRAPFSGQSHSTGPHHPIELNSFPRHGQAICHHPCPRPCTTPGKAPRHLCR